MKSLFGSPVLTTAAMLVASNLFMTFAWCAHLKNLTDKPWYMAAFISWGIVLCQYLLMVPGNRIGYTAMNLAN